MKERWLVLSPGTKGEKKIFLEKSAIEIGRSPDSSIRLDQPAVSSRHASIICAQTRTTLIDLESTNGTFVNGERTHSRNLVDGDQIRFGETMAVFHEKDESAKSSGFDMDAFPEKSALNDLKSLIDRLALTESNPVAKDDISAIFRRIAGGLKRMDSLVRILDHVLQKTGKRDLISTILEEIRDLLRLDACGIYLEADARFYVLENDSLSVEEQTETISSEVLQRVLGTGEPAVLTNVGEDSQVVGFKSLMRFRINSLLCIPILELDRKPIGALYCIQRQTGPLEELEKDRHFLRAASNAIALALRSHAFLESEKRTAREQGKETSFPIIRKLQQEKENLALRLSPPSQGDTEGLGPIEPHTLSFVEKAAGTDLPVLLIGETGVGKSVWAKEVHSRSRKGKPFVVVDCTTLPQTLIESELFGYEKGAFTGAAARKEGRVFAAREGTLFIDEIGDLSLDLQGKLLRLVQSGEFEPLGSTQTRRSKARLIFATNQDLRKNVESGTFRADLFFRLNVLSFRIPSLRECKDLILPMAQHFLMRNREILNPKVTGFDEQVVSSFMKHPWPGNIRELENCVLRGLVNATTALIRQEDVEIASGGVAVQPTSSEPMSLDLKAARESVDRAYIEKALSRTGHNVSRAAKELNISRNALMELAKKYGL